MARILVADDDGVQLQLFQILLESAGHSVSVADAPAEMLRQLEDGPHVLIMDLRFPDIRVGLSLIRRVHELSSKIPVIILSGWPEDLYGQPEEAMVSRILVKPIPAAELISAVASVV